VSDERELLRRTAELAADFLESLDERPVFPLAPVEELGAQLAVPLPDTPTDTLEVVEALARTLDSGIVASAGGRYFGFVTGGALPAALAADWLTSAWDQNTGLFAGGPAASAVEQVAGEWVKEILGLPREASIAFVTGCQMAHVTCLAAARHHVLARAGWDVGRDGLARSPGVRVIAGARRHVTIDRALRLLGIGAASIVEIPADGRGRMQVGALASVLATVDGPTIVCTQAGEVNTGSFDAIDEIASLASEARVWLHVDGAFGIWAAASPAFRGLVEGLERADSWAFDGHKWLNVPYDCGVAACAHSDAHGAAMSMAADYLRAVGSDRNLSNWTPEASRRARGITVYAALRSLGRDGVAELVERCCARARQFARGISELPGCEVLNEVVLNQVLFRFADDETTQSMLASVQAGGEAWMGGTMWDGRAAIRVSVSNWRTSEEDIRRTVAAFESAIASLG
jgi:glutamate/tyrosine decarboxylase-like PLP-dependent enzyme